MSKYSNPKQTVVKKSYAGLGLFAAEDIKKGTFIIEYTGTPLNEEESNKKGGKYLFEVHKDLYLDGTDRKNKGRYANHSCRPNAEVTVYKNRVYINSIKNIKSGEEVVYDYGKEYFDEYIKPFGCRCPKHADEKKKSVIKSKTATNK